jgi:predicted RNA-binding Zn ribbon-like protein
MESRPPAIFIADAPGLDFLNSIATPVDTAIDWIDDGEGYLSWLEQADLVPGDVLQDMRARALPGEVDKVADQARSLREWFRGFVRQHKGRPLTAEALVELEPLNRLLERDETFSRIAPRPAGQGSFEKPPFELATLRRWRTPDALLLPVGKALAQLVCTEDFSHVKACEGPTCTLLFADHTRGRGRRWCSMAICGNRAKQAAYRDRLKSNKN